MIIVSDILFTRAGSHCKSARSEAPKGTHKNGTPPRKRLLEPHYGNPTCICQRQKMAPLNRRTDAFPYEKLQLNSDNRLFLI